MQIGVRVLPKEEVLDSQGRTVQKTLEQNGFELKGCRVGRYIVLNVNEDNEERALQKAKEISEFVLYNPLIEKYELEVIHES